MVEVMTVVCEDETVVYVVGVLTGGAVPGGGGTGMEGMVVFT
jgi:hypothetical protein